MQDMNAMTDEEFERHMESFSPTESEQDSNNVKEEEAEESKDTEDTEEEEESKDTDTKADEQETSESEEETKAEESQEAEEDVETTEDTEQTDDSTGETNVVDYKAFYEQVTSDYKANGRVMPGLKNPDDFKTALAMASNYALKTTALKPHLGRIKTLEKAGVTDDELNEMLEFRNRNPEIIKKALKDAGIDPLDIDTEAPVTYTPKNYIVSETEVKFEEVIDTIKDTPEFAMTSKVVTEVWDEASKQAMLANPALIRGLNEEIQMGRFDTIQGIVEQRKMLGKTNGMSDLEMYKEIATAMNQANTANNSNSANSNTTSKDPVQKVQDPAINEQKKKAGISTKKTVTAVKKYDPTKLSDEEFLKLLDSGAKFI